MTSLMPETIEPATGGSAGGPGGTLPLPKAKKARKVWGEAAVAHLMHWHSYGHGTAFEDGVHTQDEAMAKLVSLGYVAKPEKPTVDRDTEKEIREFVGSIDGFKEPLRTLAVKHAIKALTALLPKRAPK